MKKYLFIALLTLLSYAAGADNISCSCDYLTYNGREHAFEEDVFPFEAYREKNQITIAALFKREGRRNRSCNRGYYADWLVEDGKLYLLKIHNETELLKRGWRSIVEKWRRRKYANLKKLFPNEYKNGKVFAHWVGGEFYSTFGDYFTHYHQELPGRWFDFYHEFEHKFTVTNGLVQVETFDNGRPTVAPESFKYGYEIQQYIDSLINWRKLPSLPKDPVVKVRLDFSANEHGVVDSIRVTTWSIKQEKWKDIAATSLAQEIIRVMKTLPRDVRYKHGKFFRKEESFFYTIMPPLQRKAAAQKTYQITPSKIIYKK